MKNNNGIVLLAVLLTSAILFLIIENISSILISHVNIINNNAACIKTFYLSEAGIEMSKGLISNNSSWYTDSPHTDNDKKWLLSVASGITFHLGEGGFKIIKESGRNTVYSVGFLGNNIINSPSYSFQKISYNIPFIQKKWEEF